MHPTATALLSHTIWKSAFFDGVHGIFSGTSNSLMDEEQSEGESNDVLRALLRQFRGEEFSLGMRH
jgi:hypothetical protein